MLYVSGSSDARRGRPPSKKMQLTKLRVAPVLRAEVPPCAPAGETDGGTASQLIRSVRRLAGWRYQGPAGGPVRNRCACLGVTVQDAVVHEDRAVGGQTR